MSATDPVLAYALVLAIGTIAGLVSGIVGTGAAVILLPVLAIVFGPKSAIPIMAIVALMSNFAKITAWWKEVDWRACGAYALAGIPGAALGARTMLLLPPRAIDIALGTFFIIMIPGRRWLAARSYKVGLLFLVPAGFAIGWLTGIVVSTGPLSLPVFTSYGLVKGAFIATESAASLALYLSKAITFRSFGALPTDIIVQGVITGSSVMVGAYLSKMLVERLSITTFQYLLDAVMLISGCLLLWSALD
jgi:uncharacterized membrane protein YfcA